MLENNKFKFLNMNITVEEQNMSETRTGKDMVQCDHEWKAEGLTKEKSHVELVCVKCGAKKEIELFP
jgi:hypothetical protein